MFSSVQHDEPVPSGRTVKAKYTQVLLHAITAILSAFSIGEWVDQIVCHGVGATASGGPVDVLDTGSGAAAVTARRGVRRRSVWKRKYRYLKWRACSVLSLYTEGGSWKPVLLSRFQGPRHLVGKIHSATRLRWVWAAVGGVENRII